MHLRGDASCSELEFIILAMIGSSTTSGYAMRKRMASMHGGRWSTESGSIYRALKRLLDAKLIEVSGRAGPENRQRTEYALTERGSTELERWMNSSMPQHLVETLDDPIRARLYFLELVSSAERIKTLNGWIDASKRTLDLLKDDRKALALGVFDKLAQEGYARHLQTRIAWLKDVVTAVESSPN